jgi:hypothetical protein
MKVVRNGKIVMYELDLFDIPKDVFKKFVNSRGEGRVDMHLNQSFDDGKQYFRIHESSKGYLRP